MTLESIEKLRELACDINGSEIVDHMQLYPSCVFDGAWLDSWHCEFDRVLEALEREIAERFIELPEGWTAEQASEVLDLWPKWDDGSPCMFGDEFTCYPKYACEKKYEVFERLTIYWKSHVWNRGEDNESPHNGGFYEWNYMRPGGDGCEEYRPTKRKPRTVEDMLALFLTACGDDDPHYYDEQIAEYADELREMAKEGEL